MSLDELEQAVVQILREATLQDAVLVERKLLIDIERLVLTRKLDGETRYLRITPIDDADRAWDFEVLGGTYGNVDPSKNLDGRRGGDGQYVIERVVKPFLIDLGDWNDIPPFEYLNR